MPLHFNLPCVCSPFPSPRPLSPSPSHSRDSRAALPINATHMPALGTGGCECTGGWRCQRERGRERGEEKATGRGRERNTELMMAHRGDSKKRNWREATSTGDDRRRRTRTLAVLSFQKTQGRWPLRSQVRGLALVDDLHHLLRLHLFGLAAPHLRQGREERQPPVRRVSVRLRRRQSRCHRPPHRSPSSHL